MRCVELESRGSRVARILIVEDSSFMRGEIRKFLEAEGHEVVAEGRNGLEGVELYLEHRPDLTLLDITMPTKNGHQCLDEVMAADPEARVLMVSAVQDRKLVMHCLKLGARGFIEKPLKLREAAFCSEVRTAIREALDK